VGGRKKLFITEQVGLPGISDGDEEVLRWPEIGLWREPGATTTNAHTDALWPSGSISDRTADLRAAGIGGYLVSYPHASKGGMSMKGLGKFQMEQVKHRDARVFALCQHLRTAIDILEKISTEPFLPPIKPTPESASLSTPTPPAPLAMRPEKLAYTIKEASAALGVSKATIYRTLANGELHAKKLGSRTLIPADEIRRWISSFPSARR
jgi:excisionase family DNA binding protein